MNVIFSAIAGIISGGLSAMGLGAGTVLLLYLTLFTDTKQLTAQGINLIFFIPCAVVALFFHLRSKLVNVKFALLCGAGGAIGALVGVYLAKEINQFWLRKCFAVFLLMIGIRECFIFYKEMKKKKAEKISEKQD